METNSTSREKRVNKIIFTTSDEKVRQIMILDLIIQHRSTVVGEFVRDDHKGTLAQTYTPSFWDEKFGLS